MGVKSFPEAGQPAAIDQAVLRIEPAEQAIDATTIRHQHRRVEGGAETSGIPGKLPVHQHRPG